MTSDRRMIKTFVSTDDTALVGDIVVPIGRVLDVRVVESMGVVAFVELECDQDFKPVYTTDDTEAMQVRFIPTNLPFRAEDFGQYHSTIVYAGTFLHAFVRRVSR